MNDIQAAADRLRRHEAAKAAKADGNPKWRLLSPYMNGEHNSHIGQDNKILAAAYLSLDPASLPRPDDGEGISAERLERCGAKKTALDEWSFPLSDKVELRVINMRYGDWIFGTKNALNGDWVPIPGWKRTMGDLRKLCIGLGITLKETE